MSISNAIVLKRKCPQCKKVAKITVNAKDHADWSNGKLAQDAFPYLKAWEREALISGICDTCWDTLFLPNAV